MQTLMLSGSAGLSRDREAFREAHFLTQSDACRQTSPLCQGQFLSAPLKPSVPECIPARHDSSC